MTHWKAWAEAALRMMRERGVDSESARDALLVVALTGDEPYHTLKGFVCRMEEQAKVAP